MMKALRTSETSVIFNVTTRRYIPEDSKLYKDICLKKRTESEKPLGRPKCRWEDNTKHVRELEYGGVNWVKLTQGTTG
jgi:hypothetical protein